MQYCLYILYSSTVDRYYIGVTKDLDTRPAQHNAGYAHSTKGRGPLQVVYTEPYPTRSEARTREAFLKRKKSRAYLEWLIARK